MQRLQDITLGRYLPGDSFLHRLDPRSKILAFALLAGILFSSDHLPGLLWMFIPALLAVRLSSFSLLFLLKGLRLFLWLFVFTAVFHLFFTPGDSFPPFPIAGLTVTRQGALSGAAVFIQLMLALLFAHLFTLTTEPGMMTRGFERLFSPLKIVGIRVDEIAVMLTLVIRFIPVLQEEADRLLNAQRGRGVDLSAMPFMKRTRNLVALLGPLFTGIFERSDRIVIAMASRGFGSGAPRGALKELAFRQGDYLLFCLLSVFSLLYLIYG